MINNNKFTLVNKTFGHKCRFKLTEDESKYKTIDNFLNKFAKSFLDLFKDKVLLKINRPCLFCLRSLIFFSTSLKKNERINIYGYTYFFICSYVWFVFPLSYKKSYNRETITF